jgi:hypothetical protein
MEIVIADEVQKEIRPETTRTGRTPRQWILTEEGRDGLAFRLVRSEYQGGDDAFTTPRHHHAFQQIRWAQSGAMNFAPDQDVDEGDIAYFPRGAYYGPQRRDHGVGLTLQFGFGPEMMGGKDAREVYRAGVQKLLERGRMDDGLYVDTDPQTGEERRREPAEAVAEDIMGEKFPIPAEGYAAPILMHPRAYPFYALASGVEVKHLGGFYDHSGPNADVRISIVRLSDGGVFRLGAERAQVVWSTSRGLVIDEREYPELTCAYSARDEEAAISGVDGVEVYVVEFPILD